ncbi:hypothetical protein BH10CYA1_BH10CYA1_55880 [soil metagenome]
MKHEFDTTTNDITPTKFKTQFLADTVQAAAEVSK